MSPRTVMFALALVAALPAQAATLAFSGQLSPTSEVPPVTGEGSGTAEAKLDTTTHMLTYTVTFGGFGTPITMAHFHGPAGAGVNAGVQIPLAKGTVTSPIIGSAKLTAIQEAQIQAGQWYANLHTAAFPKGAARGQLLLVK